MSWIKLLVEQQNRLILLSLCLLANLI